MRLAENLTANGAASTSYLDAWRKAARPAAPATHSCRALIHAQSAMLATSEVFWGIAILFGLLIGFVWLTKPPFGVAGGAAGGH